MRPDAASRPIRVAAASSSLVLSPEHAPLPHLGFRPLVKTARNNPAMLAGTKEGDDLIAALPTNGKNCIFLGCRDGQAIHFAES